MKAEDIIKLLDAGYTKEEIISITQSNQPEQKEQPAQPEQKEQPAESPALAGITKTLESMTKAIQAMNLRLSSVEQPKQETAEDILATIINPTFKKE